MRPLEYGQDARPATARLASQLVLLTLLANGCWAVADAAIIIAELKDPSHRLLQPYRATDRMNRGRFVTPTRAGVTVWIVVSRGAIVGALAGWAYFIVRHESALAACVYGIAAATLAVGPFFLADPPRGPRDVMPVPTTVAAGTAWMLACAGIATWYAWSAWSGESGEG